MILGRGTAANEPALIAEYHAFLEANGDISNPVILQRLKDAPGIMCRRIGKPLAQWCDEDLLALYPGRQKTTWHAYNAFLAYVFFKGYRRASLPLLTALPLELSRFHRHALAPYRQQLEQAQQALGYRSQKVGSELNLLIALLAVVSKPLKELTRADFDSFRNEYQQWYRGAQRQQNGRPNACLTRLEFYLVHWGIFPPASRVFRHEEHFAQLQHGSIRSAIVVFMNWCEVKYQPSTIDSRRAALLKFFLWFQAHYPTRGRLAEVTRAIAVAYAQHLKELRTQGRYALIYCNDLYRSLRLFFEFAIREGLDTAPDRNPFALGDMPRLPDPVPRYLSDRDVRQVLQYCEQSASLKERTVVTLLFHTGIRAAELADLKASDIVQVQGKWKLHIHEGKGLKDRLIPLTVCCLAVLQAWQAEGWEQINEHLFSHYGRPWRSAAVGAIIRKVGRKLGLAELTPHRFRHTFAVSLLNYGMRESALQKVMGHATLNMTLEYARILDQTVEQAFTIAVEQMQDGPISWVPNFFVTADYSLFAADDAVSWIRLPHGYCRRNPKLHCESDVKCLLCDRFVASPADLPRLTEMYERFQSLGMQVKADVVASQIRRLEAPRENGFIPVDEIRIGHDTAAHPRS